MRVPTTCLFYGEIIKIKLITKYFSLTGTLISRFYKWTVKAPDQTDTQTDLGLHLPHTPTRTSFDIKYYIGFSVP